jgi:hypothetical protein
LFDLHCYVLVLNKFWRVAFGSKMSLDSGHKMLLKVAEGLEIVCIRISCLHGWANSLSASILSRLRYSLVWRLQTESGFSFSLQVIRWFRNSLIAESFGNWSLNVILLQKLVYCSNFFGANWCAFFRWIALPCDFNLNVQFFLFFHLIN